MGTTALQQARATGNVDVVLTKFSGQLDEAASRRLRTSMCEYVRAGRLTHAFDVRELADMDSRTLAALIRALRVVREVGGSVSLIVDQPNILRILSITALDRIFPICRSESDMSCKA